MQRNTRKRIDVYVTFDNIYRFFDTGNLNYEHWQDIALRVLEIGLEIQGRLPTPVDFPIRITWEAKSSYTKKGKERDYSGWPLDWYIYHK